MSPDAAPPRTPVAFRLYGVTDPAALRGRALDDWLAVLCWHGLRGVELRARELDDAALLQLALLCRPIFDRHHLQWLVNGSAGVARAAGATGVHLRAGQDPGAARALLEPGALVGQSVHGVAEAERAAAAGADFVVFGPVFATPSKAASGPPLGLTALAAACARVAVPVFAIGGMTPERAEACRAAGAHGAAAVSSLMATDEPEETLARYAHALEHL